MDRAKYRGEGRNSQASVVGVAARFHGFPVSSRGHHGADALVSAIRPVVPRGRGTAGRTKRRSRSRHRLPIGATLHAQFADLTLRLSGCRPTRADHGRARLETPRPRGGPTLLHTYADHAESHTHRRRHRWRADLSRVLDELVPAAWHHVERYASNHIEADTAVSNTGCDRCAAYAPAAPRV